MSNIDGDKVSVSVGDTPLELADNSFALLLKDTGTIEFTAKATDRDGQTVISKASCEVYDLSDRTCPTAEITSPSMDDVLTKPVDIKGSVYDEKKINFWKLEYQMTGEEEWFPLAEGKKTSVMKCWDIWILLC